MPQLQQPQLFIQEEVQSLQDADPITKRGHLSIFLLLLPETVCIPSPSSR
jgi:hypothetical protein